VIAVATGWYVYGVAALNDALDDALAALGGVRTVAHDGLAAVVGEVPLDEYGEQALAERLNDRAWVEEKARAHEDVLHVVVAVTAVVPLRFGTVYRELDDVRRLLAERGAALIAMLERVRGRIELGVKGWLDRGRLAATLAESDEPGERSDTGRAYLERRRREQQSAEKLAGRAAALAQEAHERLLAVAVDGVRNRPQPRELTERDEEMLLNGAYLVAAGDTALAAEVARLNAAHGPLGVSYELTGPWPPHNFVELPEAA
jgi:hypothetical protein